MGIFFPSLIYPIVLCSLIIQAKIPNNIFYTSASHQNLGKYGEGFSHHLVNLNHKSI